MIVALVLLVLLALSVFGNLSQCLDGLMPMPHVGS